MSNVCDSRKLNAFIKKGVVAYEHENVNAGSTWTKNLASLYHYTHANISLCFVSLGCLNMRVATCGKYNLIDHCDFGERQIAKHLGDLAIIAKLIFVDIWRLSKGTGTREHCQVAVDFEGWIKPGIFFGNKREFLRYIANFEGFFQNYFFYMKYLLLESFR